MSPSATCKYGIYEKGNVMMAGSAEKQVGQQCGNYRLLHLVARDSFAEVYAGEHVYLKTRAMIKVIRAGLTSEELEGFLAEVRVLARLKHPDIVRVLEFGVQADQPFLVMEYASNGSLRQRHPEGSTLPPATILDYVRHIASALQYAHDEHLVHQNLRPETILLGPHNQPLLGDFTLSVLEGSALDERGPSSTGEALTAFLDYKAPEQSQGKPCPASDQYALAVIVYEWLCGQRPPPELSGEATEQHLSAPAQPSCEEAPSLPPAARQVLLKALSTDPALRFATINDFAHALEDALRPAIAPDQQAPGTPGPSPLRKRSVLTTITLIALVGVVITSSLLFSSRALFSSKSSFQMASATATAQASLATVNARFTGQTPQEIYQHVTGVHPIITDPLSRPGESTWQNEHLTAGACTFATGAYHINSAAKQPMLCLSRGNNLSNFAFQARVTIVKGSFAGLCFRVNSSGTRFYRFALDANQDYYAFEVANTGLYSLLFTEDRKVDLNQSYLVTVIAVGSHFYFYLDGHYITDVIDPSNTLGSGAIGLTAGSSIGPSTEAVFSNVEVWKL